MPGVTTEPVLCVTGAERTTAALAARLGRHPGLMHEVRLDLLERIDDAALALLSSPRVLATCRGRAEGGGFQGSEEERAQVLDRALARGPGFLDVELSTAKAVRDALVSHRDPSRTRIVLSHHGTAGTAHPTGSIPTAESLSREPADVLKIALPVTDAAELGALRRVLAGETRPVVRIGMGDAGLLSRVLPARFGSPWTYVAADGGETTAPGQISVSRAVALRASEEPSLTPLGVIGGPQVLRSNGQRVYNALFARARLPFHYLPVVSERPEVLALLEELGFAGVAVTMPAKVVLMGHVQEIDDAAREVGALNTVLLRDGRRRGFNTDLPALRALLPEGRGRTALVLGAGGAARAALCALRSLGWASQVSARRAEQAQALEPFGARAIDWDSRGASPFDLLVNATPVGADGRSDPLPATASLKDRVVLDMVVTAPHDQTPLIARAQSEGAAQTIPGVEMWLRQGVLQMKALTGLSLSIEALRGVLHG
ncbi:MAG: type I 3-dehydroquinate dehydratase [Deltaproteobacteria bacterium]|nr:type I 3-dehydroquinate dehydratase [Deltaproteobacteria bacterium]